MAKTMGITDVTCFAGGERGAPVVTITSTFILTNSAMISAKALVASLGPAMLDHNGTTLDPAEFMQSL